MGLDGMDRGAVAERRRLAARNWTGQMIAPLADQGVGTQASLAAFAEGAALSVGGPGISAPAAAPAPVPASHANPEVQVLLQRLRAQRPGDPVVYAPEFRREIEEPIAGAIGVPPEVPLVVTEGNYLLLDQPHWNEVGTLLDEVWYVDVDDALRVSRLVARHERHGRSPEAARAWVEGTDEPNARLIAATRMRATWHLTWG